MVVTYSLGGHPHCSDATDVSTDSLGDTYPLNLLSHVCSA
jgi:hypothetical protein